VVNNVVPSYQPITFYFTLFSKFLSFVSGQTYQASNSTSNAQIKKKKKTGFANERFSWSNSNKFHKNKGNGNSVVGQIILKHETILPHAIPQI
jgi:hypothetical protein